MTASAEPTNFNGDFDLYLSQSSTDDLFELATACTTAMDGIMQKGFSEVNEGFDPEAGTKPIIMVRETLLPIFSKALNCSYSADDLRLADSPIVFELFKSDNPVDLAIKGLQDTLRLMGSESAMRVYIGFTNALEKTIQGGLTAKDPLFVKSDGDADTLLVIFAGMVCFPEFKKSVGAFRNVDQLHVLDPNRSWYMQGPDGEWNGYDYYSALLKEHIERLKAENGYGKVCFMGNSMGGSAACMYSEHADAILAFCPQTEIVRENIPPEIGEMYKDLLLENLKRSCTAGKTFIIHRGCSESDIKQCGRLPDGIAPIVHEECTVHNVPGYLKSKGILLDVIGSVI